MVELLAPAGSYESLCAAVNAGADAVYIGGSRFGARAYADNPGEEALLRGIDYCHLHGRKLYLTVNTLLKERELEEQLYDYIRPYYCEGLDGVIVQDFGVVRFLKEYFPQLPLHASTQMTVTGADGAELTKREGLTRIVPARELSLDDDPQHYHEDRPGGGDIYSRCDVLLLFWSVSVQQYDRRQERKPRPVCTAVPVAVSAAGQYRWEKTAIRAEHEGSVCR